jgi:hypothetical protein
MCTYEFEPEATAEEHTRRARECVSVCECHRKQHQCVLMAVPPYSDHDGLDVARRERRRLQMRLPRARGGATERKGKNQSNRQAYIYIYM